MIFFAWATIERHLLVFRNQWLSTVEKHFYIHYLPIIILIIYCLVWYSVMILFLFCFHIDNRRKFNDISYLRMLLNPTVKYFDLLCHQVIPSFIIIIFSIALLMCADRWQKTDLNQLVDQVQQ